MYNIIPIYISKNARMVKTALACRYNLYNLLLINGWCKDLNSSLNFHDFKFIRIPSLS